MKIFQAITLVALLSETTAFAPSGSSSSFVQKKTITLRPQHVVSYASERRSSSSLNMNLFDRFSRVAKANINNVLKNMEDPEKILNQAVEDMQVRREKQKKTKEQYRIPTQDYNPFSFNLTI